MKIFISKSAITKLQAIFVAIIIIIAAIAGVVYYMTLPTTPVTEKKILRINFANAPKADPAAETDEVSSSTYPNLYDTLVHPTTTGDVEPHLAESWDISADGLTWTFNLRHGVKFHDGSELTAQDVKFSMDRLTAMGKGFAYLFAPYVEQTTVVDTYTVRFKLNQPVGPFIAMLVRLYIVNDAQVTPNIVTPGPYGEMGDYGTAWLMLNDAGSGAYILKEAMLGDHFTLERFKDYFGTFATNAPDEVVFYWNPEAAVVHTWMAQRNLEISDLWKPLEFYQAIDQVEGINLQTRAFAGGCPAFLSLMCQRPPMDDIHFRKAIAYAVDYETVWKDIFPGSTPIKGPVSPNTPGANPNLFQYTYNMTKAMEELKLSKYYEHLDEYTLQIHGDTPGKERVGLMVAAALAELGIKSEVKTLPVLTFFDEMTRQETTPEISIIFVAPHFAEAGSMLLSKYHSDSAGTWEQSEWLLNATLDAMLEDAIQTLNRTERFQKYYVIQEQIIEMCPSVFLCDWYTMQAYQSHYIDWPTAKGSIIPVMGYEYEVRLIGVDPEKRAELL